MEFKGLFGDKNLHPPHKSGKNTEGLTRTSWAPPEMEVVAVFTAVSLPVLLNVGVTAGAPNQSQPLITNS